jgi:hypothetical protein
MPLRNACRNEGRRKDMMAVNSCNQQPLSKFVRVLNQKKVSTTIPQSKRPNPNPIRCPTTYIEVRAEQRFMY